MLIPKSLSTEYPAEPITLKPTNKRQATWSINSRLKTHRSQLDRGATFLILRKFRFQIMPNLKSLEGFFWSAVHGHTFKTKLQLFTLKAEIWRLEAKSWILWYIFSSIPLLLGTRTIQPKKHSNIASLLKAEVWSLKARNLGTKNEFPQFLQRKSVKQET